MSIGKDEEKQLVQPEREPATVPTLTAAAGPVPPQRSHVRVQTAEETVTGELLRYLDAMARGGPGGPLLVVAPSGTGKSSLLGAGLLNALAGGRLPAPGSAAWPRLMITPGSHPLRTRRAALATLANAQTAASDPASDPAGNPRSAPAHAAAPPVAAPALPAHQARPPQPPPI